MAEQPCIGCGGRLGWYDPETGIWVNCLACKAGQENNTRQEQSRKATQEICDRKSEELRKSLLT